MRKFAGLAVVFAILISLAACGQSQISPFVEIDPEGKYFECSAIEFIALINDQLQNSDLEGISFSTEPNSNKQYIADKTTYLKFEETAEGKLRSVSIYWQNTTAATENDQLAAGAVMGFIPYCFGLGDVTLVNEFNAGDPSAENALKDFPPVHVSFVQIEGRCMMKVSPIFVSSEDEPSESRDPVIEEGPEAETGTYNEEASNELTSNISSNFGIPDAEADWYQYIDDVSVYDADPGYIVVTVNGGSTEDVERIGNTVFGNYVYNNDDGLRLVIVHDADGEELWRREV